MSVSSGQWDVLNTVIVLIAAGCAVGLSVLVLLVCVGAKRRLMSVRNVFVPVWAQKINKRQKRVILSEQEQEASFRMAPFCDPGETLHGWFDGRGEALGDELSTQLEQLKQEVDIACAEAEASSRAQPRVLSNRTSRHPTETHLCTLMVQTARLVEKHAVAVSPQLAREPMQEIPAYIKVSVAKKKCKCRSP